MGPQMGTVRKKVLTQNEKLHKPIEFLHKIRRLMTFRKVTNISFSENPKIHHTAKRTWCGKNTSYNVRFETRWRT